jgi:predicted AlkP superfamily phosphohydrolase/phosphomutase
VKQPRRIVMVGLELGDGPALYEWARAGLLPAVRDLLDAGSWRWLQTTANQLHISAWPSIYTGTPPGEHGIYYTHQPAPGLQGYRRFHPGLYGRPTFWKLLDEAGRRCTVFDPPYVHPEEGFGGTLIHDWGTWAHYLQTGCVPAGAIARVESHCGLYPLGLEAHDLGFTPLDAKEIAGRLVKAVDVKTAATCGLLEESPGQLFFVVFGETHVAGHYCWPRSGDPRKSPTPGLPLLQVYQALDRGIGRIRSAAGPETLFLLVSGDGIGPNYAGWHLLPDVLERLGVLVNAGQALPSQSAPARRGFDPVKALRDLLPKDFRKSLARRLPTTLRDKLAQRVDMADVDWAHTAAYCLPTDLEGCIRVNLKGREPLGIVEPGEHCKRVLDELERALLALRDPVGNEPIVERVLRTDVAFPGHRRDYLPDLVVNWKGAAPITAAVSDQVAVIQKPSPDPRPGTHTGPAFALLAGPGIPERQTLQSGSILDLAPNVLAWLGAPVPGHMPGQVWPEMEVA